MIKSLFTCASGMKAQEIVIDNTANNLANMNTTGFKRSQMEFQDLLYITKKPPGTAIAQGLEAPTGLQIGSGVRPSSNTKIFTEGPLEITDNPLDVAIEGDGFLEIAMPNGEIRYTRDGALRLNSQLNLVNTEGYLVNPAITIPQDWQSISIGADGTVSVITSSSPTQPQTIGQLTMVRFPNPAGLESKGHNQYAQTQASGDPITGIPGQNGIGTFQQGHLERSNVEVVSELVKLILAQRAYEINSRAIRASDEMLSLSNNILAR
jgi:flagellar basal-body rod protein FlgG